MGLHGFGVHPDGLGRRVARRQTGTGASRRDVRFRRRAEHGVRRVSVLKVMSDEYGALLLLITVRNGSTCTPHKRLKTLTGCASLLLKMVILTNKRCEVMPGLTGALLYVALFLAIFHYTAAIMLKLILL